jgi:DNA repair protein RadA/Sms
MVLAVLEAHAGLRLGGHDVYLNVAGGLRIQEPAADIAVAAALISSFANSVLPQDSVFFGEVSLSGSVRPVAHAGLRMKEATRLGFARAIGPSGSPGSSGKSESGISLNGLTSLDSLVADIAARGVRAGRPQAVA